MIDKISHGTFLVTMTAIFLYLFLSTTPFVVRAESPFAVSSYEYTQYRLTVGVASFIVGYVATLGGLKLFGEAQESEESK